MEASDHDHATTDRSATKQSIQDSLALSNASGTQRLLKKMRENYNPKRKRTGREKYMPDRSKPMYPFSTNCNNLKKFIQSTYMDYELIDYDELHKMDDRLTSGMTYDELTAEIAEDSQRVWKFLSEEVIFRESTNLNKH